MLLNERAAPAARLGAVILILIVGGASLGSLAVACFCPEDCGGPLELRTTGAYRRASTTPGYVTDRTAEDAATAPRLVFDADASTITVTRTEDRKVVIEKWRIVSSGAELDDRVNKVSDGGAY